MKNCCLLVFLFSLSFNLNAQTNADTTIYTNQTWSKANGPFLITDSLVIYPGATLTVEAGTQIKLSGTAGIEVQGNIVLNGTASDSIIFYRDTLSNNPTEKAMLYVHDTIHISYCSFKNSYTGAILFDSLIQGSSSLTNCSFFNNYHVVGLRGKPAMNLQINSCRFSNNKIVLPPLNASIHNCTFNNNNSAISQANGVHKSTFSNNTIGVANADSISNCFFSGNKIAIGNGIDTSSISAFRISGLGNSAPTVSSVNTDVKQVCNNNIITGNSIGIVIYSPYFDIQNNIISGNNIGIEILPNINASDTSYIKNNTICNNSKYNLEWESPFSFSFPSNCWCSSDSAYIRSTILDGYDNPSYGLADYIPIATCPGASVDTIYGSTTYYLIHQTYKFYIDSGTTGVSYIWMIDGDTVGTGGSATINWSTQGFHTVSCTAYENGIAISSYTLPIDAYASPLAILPGTSAAPVTVYPNPTTGIVTLETPFTNARLIIYNVLGVPIQTIQLTNKQSVINLATTIPGVYYLIIEFDEGSYSQKIIVE